VSTKLGGRYELVREIGAGGMGRVFQAVDTETGRAVAAKIMIANSEDNLEALLRFQQEGAVLSTLKHPNIVEVYGTFLEEHTSCIIMELLEGHALSQVLEVERMDLARAGTLLRRTLPALAVTLAGFTGLRALIALLLRPHYMTPVTVYYKLTAPFTPAGSYLGVGQGIVGPHVTGSEGPQDQQPQVHRSGNHVAQQLQARPIGPMQIIHHQQHRGRAGRTAQEIQDRAEQEVALGLWIRRARLVHVSESPSQARHQRQQSAAARPYMGSEQRLGCVLVIPVVPARDHQAVAAVIPVQRLLVVHRARVLGPQFDLVEMELCGAEESFGSVDQVGVKRQAVQVPRAVWELQHARELTRRVLGISTRIREVVLRRREVQPECLLGGLQLLSREESLDEHEPTITDFIKCRVRHPHDSAL